MKKNSIAIVSSSRADFDLLKNFILLIKKNKKFDTKFIVTGTHLKKKFGQTLNYIQENKIIIDKVIKYNFGGQNSKYISKQISDTINLFSKYISNNKPELIIVLGDRFEIFAVSIAAYVNHVPIAHIHGGEITAGSLDDGFRHSISKLSSLHFVANKKFKSRLVLMGEHPNTVHNVGYLAYDNILKNKYLSILNLEKKLNIKMRKGNVIICYHPETKNEKMIKKNTDYFCNFITEIACNQNLTILITSPGDDYHSNYIDKQYNEIVKKHNNIYYKKHLGQHLYFNCLNMFNAIIGNSSSGVLEAPFFNINIINIGSRQYNRNLSSRITNVDFSKLQNNQNLKKIIFKKNRFKNFKKIKNDSYTSFKIIKLINNYFTKTKKNYNFYDAKILK